MKRKSRKKRRSYPSLRESYKGTRSVKPSSVNAAAYRNKGERALTV